MSELTFRGRLDADDFAALARVAARAARPAWLVAVFAAGAVLGIAGMAAGFHGDVEGARAQVALGASALFAFTGAAYAVQLAVAPGRAAAAARGEYALRPAASLETEARLTPEGARIINDAGDRVVPWPDVDCVLVAAEGVAFVSLGGVALFLPARLFDADGELRDRVVAYAAARVGHVGVV